MLTVALTGGIGSGKSEVSRLFHSFGTPIIDTDLISRELVIPKSIALNQITQCFGNNILLSDGNLDRTKLRKIIFNDQQAKSSLENILHPLIQNEVHNQLNQLNPCHYVIVVIPLLIETGQQHDYDRVLSIDCPDDIRKKRLLERDALTVKQIEQIFRLQTTSESRAHFSDDIIINDTDLDSLAQQISHLHKMYLKLGKSPY